MTHRISLKPFLLLGALTLILPSGQVLSRPIPPSGPKPPQAPPPTTPISRPIAGQNSGFSVTTFDAAPPSTEQQVLTTSPSPTTVPIGTSTDP